MKGYLTSRCSTAPALRACAGQFLSRGFVVLLRKSIPQNHNLKTAAELGVRKREKLSMNPKTMLAIAVRLFAIYVILMTFSMFALAINFIKTNGASPILFVAPVFILILGFILWWFPLSVAGKIIPKDILEEQVVNFSPRSLAAAASGIFGLWVLLSALPHVVAYIGMQLYFNGSGQDSFLLSEQFFASVVQAICGLFLLYKPWFFAFKIFPTESSGN